MRISHIAMYVRDLEVVKEFYIRFFGAKAGELYHNPKTGLKSYFLSFDEGTRLELMNLPEMQDQKKVLVQMTRKSAPPRSRACAASARMRALLSQSPACWQRSISSKSTL